LYCFPLKINRAIPSKLEDRIAQTVDTNFRFLLPCGIPLFRQLQKTASFMIVHLKKEHFFTLLLYHDVPFVSRRFEKIMDSYKGIIFSLNFYSNFK